MEIGIIAEGKSDYAVLKNICYGLELIESDSEIYSLRPELSKDVSDLSHEMSEAAFSNWTLVKKECVDKQKISTFLGDANPFAGERKMIIQIDTAECEDKGFNVKRPDKKQDNYCDILREHTISKINEWLENEFLEDIFYAVCIEETEAWVHVLYEDIDTSKSMKPKEKFQKLLTRKSSLDKKFGKKYWQEKQKGKMEEFHFLSKDFQKLSSKKIQRCLKRNESLTAFINSIKK